MRPGRRRGWLLIVIGAIVGLVGHAGPAEAVTFPCGPVPTPIGSNTTLNCPVSGLTQPVATVSVTLAFGPPYTWVGDLAVTLIAPAGFGFEDIRGSLILFRGTLNFSFADVDDLGDSSNLAGPYTFTDAAAGGNQWWIQAAAVDDNTNIPSGNYRTSVSGCVRVRVETCLAPTSNPTAVTSLNGTFAGTSPANFPWILRFQGGTGTVSAASLDITTTPNPFTLVSAVLPSSRSVQAPDGVASAFATIINTGATTANQCQITPQLNVPHDFVYQTTNAQNQLVGTPNTPVSIPAGSAQPFFFAFTPKSNLGLARDVRVDFTCDTGVAQQIVGLNTLFLVSSSTPVADIIVQVLTAGNTGIMDIPGNGSGQGFFTMATANVGATDTVTVTADSGAAMLPVVYTICQTNPGTGVCLAPPAATLTLTFANGQTPTFTVFAQGTGTPIPFDPATARAFVRFRTGEAVGTVRGAASVAVRTVP